VAAVATERLLAGVIVWMPVEDGQRVREPHEAVKEDAVVADAIERIRAAEKQAEQARREGRAERKRVIVEAHEAADRLLEETRRTAREAEQSAVASARSEAEEHAERIVSDGTARTESVRSSAEARIEAGVAKVMAAITADE